MSFFEAGPKAVKTENLMSNAIPEVFRAEKVLAELGGAKVQGKGLWLQRISNFSAVMAGSPGLDHLAIMNLLEVAPDSPQLRKPKYVITDIKSGKTIVTDKNIMFLDSENMTRLLGRNASTNGLEINFFDESHLNELFLILKNINARALDEFDRSNPDLIKKHKITKPFEACGGINEIYFCGSIEKNGGNQVLLNIITFKPVVLDGELRRERRGEKHAAPGLFGLTTYTGTKIDLAYITRTENTNPLLSEKQLKIIFDNAAEADKFFEAVKAANTQLEALKKHFSNKIRFAQDYIEAREAPSANLQDNLRPPSGTPVSSGA